MIYKIFTPPFNYDNSKYTVFTEEYKEGEFPVNVFLGGTIDNGNSDDWQTQLIEELGKEKTKHPLCIYNPRRADWPSSEDHNEIDKQIKWELSHLERADLIVMNILGDSKSPISLMEIGLFARQNKLLVFCPKNFYRYDNIRVVCGSYGIPLFETNNIEYIKDRVLDYEKGIQVI